MKPKAVTKAEIEYEISLIDGAGASVSKTCFLFLINYFPEKAITTSVTMKRMKLTNRAIEMTPSFPRCFLKYQ